MSGIITKILGISAGICFLSNVTPTLAQDFKMPRLELTYEAAGLNYNTYIPGTVTVIDTDGSINEYNTQYKTRGATARQYAMKPSLNMKIRDAAGDELDVDLLGLRKASSFILDAMAIDRINMRNRVCFDIWNDFSRLPYETDFDSRNGTVGKFVEVSINGVYKGIYCVSDKINRKLLDLKKPQIDEESGEVTIRGVLYKHGTNDTLYDEDGNRGNQETPGMYNGGLNYVMQWHDAWELQEPDDYPCEEAWEPLLDLYRNHNFSNFDYVKEHFYLENLADYTIHLMALCIQDNWGNKNKYFSVVNMQGSGDKRKIVVTPWDLDTSLGGHYNGDYYDGNYSDWSPEEIVKNAPLPFGAALGNNEFKTLLRERWIEGRKGVFSVESVRRRLSDYCTLFDESGAWRRTVEHWQDKKSEPDSELYVEDLRNEVEQIADWYADRFAKMDSYFKVTETETNGVVPINGKDPGKKAVYDLVGTRVGEPTAPGVYIIDGRKVILK